MQSHRKTCLPGMTRRRLSVQQIYPTGIWEREGPEALRFLLAFYEPLRAFYKRASENGRGCRPADRVRPNPFIERTSSGRLRLPTAAAHVAR